MSSLPHLRQFYSILGALENRLGGVRTFSSPPLGKDESWSHTFTAVGDHGYSIQQYPSAKGTVTVE